MGSLRTGFSTVVENMGGSWKFDGGDLESIHGGSMGGLKWHSENLGKILEK